MALEENVFILLIIQEAGLPMKGMLPSSEDQLQAIRISHTADMTPTSVIKAILLSEARHIPTISLRIEIKRDTPSL